MAWLDKSLAEGRRAVKHATQLHYGWWGRRQLTFVFGCQRSGTKMLLRILDESPRTRVHHEDDRAAFKDFQLRSDGVIRGLAGISPAPACVFKPICDSHDADRILDRFEGSRGVWIVRDADSVARSAVQKWGEHQREVVDAVAAGDLERWGWRTARLPATVVEAIRAVHREDLTAHEGALLFWYMRNAFFFELGLDEDPRVLLVHYEDLVDNGEPVFRAVFHHVGVPLRREHLARVQGPKSGPAVREQASPEIRALCEGLQSRLGAHPRPRTQHISPVLLLINTLGTGGAERYVVTVANWLAARGAEVVVASSGGELVGDLAPEVRHIEAPLRRVRGDFAVAIGHLTSILRAHRPAAIVANSLITSWLARAAQPIARVPIVTVAHGWPESRYRTVGRLIGVADKVVAVSPELSRKLIAAGLDEVRCEVIHNGVDQTGMGRRQGALRTQRRLEMGAGEDDVLVVALGRLSEQKAHHHIVSIAESLRETAPQLRFALVGQGARFDELNALVRASGLEDRVRLLGLRQDAADLLGSADIYLNCSDWEGMPLSTIEAMAAELPIVATQTEGSAELLDERCGLVVPVGDADAMSAALERLAGDAALRSAMGRAARERAQERFSHDRMVGELSGLLTRIAG